MDPISRLNKTWPSKVTKWNKREVNIIFNRVIYNKTKILLSISVAYWYSRSNSSQISTLKATPPPLLSDLWIPPQVVLTQRGVAHFIMLDA